MFVECYWASVYTCYSVIVSRVELWNVLVIHSHCEIPVQAATYSLQTSVYTIITCQIHDTTFLLVVDVQYSITFLAAISRCSESSEWAHCNVAVVTASKINIVKVCCVCTMAEDVVSNAAHVSSVAASITDNV